MKSAKIEKPPIGLVPEFIFETQKERDRLIEITEAMERYSLAGKPVPIEWVKELSRRINSFSAHGPFKSVD